MHTTTFTSKVLLSNNKIVRYNNIIIELTHKGLIMSYTYLTTQELSELIKYNPRTIRNDLKDTVLIEGIHYIRPFGGRKILYVWEEIEKDMRTGVAGSINAMALQ